MFTIWYLIWPFLYVLLLGKKKGKNKFINAQKLIISLKELIVSFVEWLELMNHCVNLEENIDQQYHWVMLLQLIYIKHIHIRNTTETLFEHHNVIF